MTLFQLLKESYVFIGNRLITILVLSFVYSFARIKIKDNKDYFIQKLRKKEAELNLLKSQVNQHFFFNSLNIIYATALEENAQKTSESTAKLCNIFRYMLDDINKEFIPLEKEVKYIQDYTNIQLSRCSAKQDIEIEIGEIDNVQVSPAIFIPFVENAFKYGINPSKTSRLLVKVACVNNVIYFECTNSYDDNRTRYSKEEGLGIGIKNVRQRLDLVYPMKHSFKIHKTDNIFSVKINIVT